MNRKFVLVFALIVVLATVCFVSASETVKIADIEFNVPDGYTKDSNLEVGGMYIYTFTNSKDNYTIAIVENDDLSEIENNSLWTKTTINGKEGYISGSNVLHFQYVENGNLVEIDAPNKELIEQIIIE